ncbi:hypothetical protein ACE6H2_009981 [Prunus campanulata]
MEEDMVPKREDVIATECTALDPNNEEIIYLVIDREIVMFNIRTRIQSKLDRKITIDYGLNCGFFQVVVPWWPTPPFLDYHNMLMLSPPVKTKASG